MAVNDAHPSTAVPQEALSLRLDLGKQFFQVPLPQEGCEENVHHAAP